MSKHIIDKIISGGQTGADRAALDVAIALNIPYGGWCPKGRKAEDGVIPRIYRLQETSTNFYNVRTALNVRDSDGTLVFVVDRPIGGTLLTIVKVKSYRKPLFIFDLSSPPPTEKFVEWVKENHIHILNVAGSRASQSPDIYKRVYTALNKLLQKKSCEEH